MDETKQAELFKVLSVETRIRIIDLLKQRGPLGVKELAAILNITPSAVSQHLKVLRYAGLVHSERKGYWLPYEIDEAALEHCGEMLTDVCTCGCKGADRICEGKLKKAGHKLEHLKRYKQELEAELQKVEGEIREFESKE